MCRSTATATANAIANIQSQLQMQLQLQYCNCRCNCNCKCSAAKTGGLAANTKADPRAQERDKMKSKEPASQDTKYIIHAPYPATQGGRISVRRLSGWPVPLYLAPVPPSLPCPTLPRASHTRECYCGRLCPTRHRWGLAAHPLRRGRPRHNRPIFFRKHEFR